MVHYKSYILVSLQFGLLGIIAWYCGIWGNLLSLSLLLLAILVGVWAIATMRFNVSILPDVRRGQQLYTVGPYAYIRHPMYTAVLTATFAWVMNRADVISMILWLLLLGVLLTKLRYEEAQLNRRFKDYANYAKRTKYLVPYIF